MNTLNATRVGEIFMDCLFQEGEDTEGYILGEGIKTDVGFHPERLDGHKPEIRKMLLELPNEFMKSGGGGWTFLNACNDKSGNHWGEHRNMEQLFQLGIASALVESQLPKEMWGSLPGGMPYYAVLDK